MGSKKRKKRRSRAKSNALQHKISVLSITCVIVLLAIILSVASISLREKNNSYKAQEAELEEQLKEETARAEEIDALDVAKEKLGLVNPNEILFKATP